MKYSLIASLCITLTLTACATTKIQSTNSVQDLDQKILNELKRGLPLYFNHNSRQIDVRYEPYLTAASKILAQNKSFILQVDGHTDNRGSIAANQKVSLERANAVRNELVMQYNVDPKQISTQGYGPNQPIADNTTEEGRALNRRVNLTLKIQ